MDIQRLRNLTTGRLHTKMADIYEDLALITGQDGWFTHQLPSVLDAIEPWLECHINDHRFWDDRYDPTHVGEYDLPMPTAAERTAIHNRLVTMKVVK